MTISGCERVRSSWIEFASPSGGAFEAALELSEREHVSACPACQRTLRSWSLAVRALSKLPRQSAPPELDSAVVAAWHAGARTDRALRALQRLARLAPPDQLAQALDQPSTEVGVAASQVARASAPRVLDRLVQEELLDPAKARVRRHVGGLRRLPAPDELFPRVAAELSPSRRSAAARDGLRSIAARRLRFVLGAAAAFALVALPIALLLQKPSDSTRPFRVERTSSLGALSPMTRGMLDAVSSGLAHPKRS